MTKDALWRTAQIVGAATLSWVIFLMIGHLILVSRAYWWATIPGLMIVGLASRKIYPMLRDDVQREEMLLALLVLVLIVAAGNRLMP